MEELLINLQNPQVIIPVLGVCLATIIFAIIKKAIKACFAIILCGTIIASVKPVTTQVMMNNGVSIQGTILTINTDTEQHTIDLALGATFDTEKQADGSYIVTLTIPEQEPYTLTVSEETAAWIKFGGRIAQELGKTGESALHQIVGMRY